MMIIRKRNRSQKGKRKRSEERSVMYREKIDGPELSNQGEAKRHTGISYTEE